MASKKKTSPTIDAQRAAQALQARIVAMRGLTPETLSSYLESFEMGYLRYAALAWQKIRDRDDTVKAVSEKRELAVSLLNWEILPLDDSEEALAHKAALEDCYNNLVATHCLDTNQRGGVSTLIRQMLHSVGHKYAVHEIVWKPGLGTGLSAEMRFVPLQFFENTQGRLRYLASEGATTGEDLEDGGWMVTVGAGLMEATSIAYLFKQLPLKSWLIFCEKFGIPGLHGETNAAYGSEEWNRFREALTAFAQDWALVTSTGGKITPIEVNASGSQPHAQLVDRMDRAISRLWRGADLGTMSAGGQAVGSNPQESETDIFAAADAMIVSETLQHYVDRQVIAYRFGVEPKAYFQLQPPVRVNHEIQLRIDEMLIKWGCRLGKKDLMERYGRAEPGESDEIAGTAAATEAQPQIKESQPLLEEESQDPEEKTALVNAAEKGREAIFMSQALSELSPAARKVMEPLMTRLASVYAIEDPAQQKSALARLKTELPQLYKEALSRSSEVASVMERVIGTALVSGLSARTAEGHLNTPKT
jgi:phage gp29-like protein